LADRPHLILLNGTSCSGKSSLSRELREMTDRPYLAVASELFLPMLAGKFTGVDASVTKRMLEGKGKVDEVVHRAASSWSGIDAPLPKLGFQITMREEGGQPTYHAHCGPVGWSLVAGMHRAVAAMVRAGNFIVMEDVVSEVLLRDYCVALKGLDVYLVGLVCGLQELERRERERHNRAVGAVRMQFPRVHVPGEYDLRVDTETHGPTEGARLVLDHVASHPPRAFDELAARFGDGVAGPFPIETF
jgi:chloramphenicol 3-O phosphotransferase